METFLLILYLIIFLFFINALYELFSLIKLERRKKELIDEIYLYQIRILDILTEEDYDDWWSL